LALHNGTQSLHNCDEQVGLEYNPHAVLPLYHWRLKYQYSRKQAIE